MLVLTFLVPLLFGQDSTVEGDLFASSVAGIGDVNGDGHADVAAVVCSVGSDFGAEDPPSPGVAAYSGADGKRLWTGAVGLHAQRFSNRALCSVGDVNGDGRGDLALLGHRRSSRPGDPHADFNLEVALLSGRDGSMLRSWLIDSGLTDAEKAEIACVGDQDGDSSSDLAVVAVTPDKTGSGLGMRSAVWIHSCKTGEVLRRIDPDPDWWISAECVDSPGDLDADGCAEVAVLAYSRQGAPNLSYLLRPTAVVVWSGRTGRRLLVIDTPKAWFQVRICGAGDIDRDGDPDLALSGHVTKTGDSAITWEAQVRSGSDGHLLRSIPGILEDIKGGDIVCAGDVDRDGIPDLLISQYYMIEGGRVCLHSGRDGTSLRDSEEPPRYPDVSEYFGYSLAAAGDVDADGVPDWVVGQCNPWGDMKARMVIVSGREGQAIHSIYRTSLTPATGPR